MIKEGIGAEQQKSLPNYLLDAAGISLDRMPMLNVIFDRMAATCTGSLQSVAGTPWYFSVSGNMSIFANIMLQALYRGGQMFLIIPHSALNPLRQKLAHVVVGDGKASDPNWREQMESEVQRTEVTLSAVLDERVLSLSDVTK